VLVTILPLFASACLVTPGGPHVEAVAAPGFDPTSISKLAVTIGRSSQLTANSDLGRRLEDQVVQVLLTKGYTIAARSDVEPLLKELKFQHSGTTDADAAKLGRMLNVPVILLVTLYSVETHRASTLIQTNPPMNETSATVGARMISVERGEMLWTGTGSARYLVGREHASEVALAAARELALSVPGKLSGVASPKRYP